MGQSGHAKNELDRILEQKPDFDAVRLSVTIDRIIKMFCLGGSATSKSVVEGRVAEESTRGF